MSKAELLTTLQQCSASDAAVVKSAEGRLSRLCCDWDEFYPAITEIAVDSTIDFAARLQAVLYLKNAIDTIWRLNSELLNAERKTKVRCSLLSGLSEENDRLAMSIAVVIAKIARFDCPSLWPDLVPTLAQTIEHPRCPTTRLRAVLSLYHVVKCLASKRLASDRNNFKNLTQLLFAPLNTILDQQISSLTSELQTLGALGPQHKHNALSIKLFSQCLRYLAFYGLESVPGTDEGRVFLDKLTGRFSEMIRISTFVAPDNDDIVECLQSASVQFLKLLIELQTSSIAHWLPDILQMVFDCAFGAFSEEGKISEKVSVKCFNVIQSVVLSSDFKLTPLADTEEQIVHHESIRQFFSEARLVHIVQQLATRCFVVSSEDLELLESDQEAFVLQHQGAESGWQIDLCPAAQALYASVMHEFWRQLAPLVVDRWLATALSGGAQVFDKCVEVDAVLNAVGLAAEDLYRSFEFADLFRHFVLEAALWSSNDVPHSLLQRRALILCESFIGVNFAANLRPELYELVSHALSGSRLAVKLAAADLLKVAMDDYEFDAPTFVPYMQAIVLALVQLLQECTEDDCRTIAMSSLVMMAERCGVEVGAHFGIVLQVIPAVWNTDCHTIKSRILDLFFHVIQAVGPDCVQLEEGLCQVLPTAVDLTKSDHVFLLEEGLDVWLALVQQRRAPLSSQLIDLFHFMPNLLTMQTENLKVCFEICNAYVLFGSEEFASRLLAPMCASFREIIADLRWEAVVALLKCCDITVRAYGLPAVAQLSPLVVWSARQVLQEVDPIAQFGSCLAFLSRIAVVCDAETFIRLITGENTSSESVVLPSLSVDVVTLVGVWCRSLRFISHDTTRLKLCAMGLCSLLQGNHPLIVPLFPTIVATLAECLHEICYSKDGTWFDCVCEQRDDGRSDWIEATFGRPSEHEQRLKALSTADALHRVRLIDAVGELLRQTVPSSTLLAALDPDTLIQLRKYGCVS